MTVRDLRAEVVAAVEERPRTVSELALLLRVRRSSVTDVLAAGGFERASAPAGGSARAVYWSVASSASQGVPSGCARLLAVLRDGEEHSSRALYRQLGCMVHSRVAELRRRGHRIECRRAGDDYLYRLVDDTEAAA